MNKQKKLLRRFISLVCALAILCAVSPAVFAAGETQPAYVVQAETSGGVCTVTVSVRGATAYGGRLALRYDPAQLTLLPNNGKAVTGLRSGMYVVGDGVEDAELNDAREGYVGFAWAGVAVQGEQNDAEIAVIRFTQHADALDSGSLGLRYVPDEGFGQWTGAASMQIANGTPYPSSCVYLRQGYSPLAVEFAYDGADRPPENGCTITLRCRDLHGLPVSASVSLNGRYAGADGDGNIVLHLNSGTYRCLIQADGFGDRLEFLTVSKDEAVDLIFVTDEMLVEQAAEQLEIGFSDGDSAGAVTKALRLPRLTEQGVQITWRSDRPTVVTEEGLVYRPSAGDGDAAVTLTAQLTHGSATAEKAFSVTVQHKPAGTTDVINSFQPTDPAGAFQDLAGYEWAKDAIMRLYAAGVIHGTSATTYDPGAPVKRGDFILLLMNLVAPSAPADGTPFTDVLENAYYSNAITAARALGITEGVGGNRFNPDGSINRQEMAAMTVRALRVTGYLTLESAPGDLLVFSDYKDTAPWAWEDLSLLVGGGYLVGGSGRLRPTADTSRAEVAVFIDRIRAAAIT